MIVASPFFYGNTEINFVGAPDRGVAARVNRLAKQKISSAFKVGIPAGVLAAIFLALGLDSFFNYTNKMDFCISCHEMETTVYQEYQKSLHYKNVNGVRVKCPDCHVPKEYPEKFYAKIFAVKDVYHSILGTIDTKEKFEERRLIMAERVWRRMTATKSRECLNCHDYDAMNLKEQGRKSRTKHPAAMDLGMHCINCHKGVVHRLPHGVRKTDPIGPDGKIIKDGPEEGS